MLCQQTEVLNRPTNSTCRVLPELPQVLPASSPSVATVLTGEAAGKKYVAHWEIVTWSCSIQVQGGMGSVESLLHAWEKSWNNRFANYSFDVIVYDVCEGVQTPQGKDAKGNGAEASLVMMEHLLTSTMRNRAVDAFYFVPDQWTTPWVTAWGFTPQHLVNVLDEMLRIIPGGEVLERGELGRFLMAVDGVKDMSIDGREDRVCEQYEKLVNMECMATRQMKAPQSFAVSASLLRGANLLELETIIGFRNSHYKTWRSGFNLFIATLARFANNTEVGSSPDLGMFA
eukprot:TRINITY_DN28068_c0_g1_i1.p1 TRINITY_DN28068_c0_g1~~TRINITY_DN28068_c0_g1_i1.p1  ORF type:complete len:286 (-),score=43.17 TRINITY_DN28068_c0_g1_i1:9-866(-)